jgi:hypothetical protein
VPWRHPEIHDSKVKNFVQETREALLAIVGESAFDRVAREQSG